MLGRSVSGPGCRVLRRNAWCHGCLLMVLSLVSLPQPTESVARICTRALTGLANDVPLPDPRYQNALSRRPCPDKEMLSVSEVETRSRFCLQHPCPSRNPGGKVPVGHIPEISPIRLVTRCRVVPCLTTRTPRNGEACWSVEQAPPSTRVHEWPFTTKHLAPKTLKARRPDD